MGPEAERKRDERVFVRVGAMPAGSMAVEARHIRSRGPCTILAVHWRKDVEIAVAAKRCCFGCYTESSPVDWGSKLSKELVLEGKERRNNDMKAGQTEVVLQRSFVLVVEGAIDGKNSKLATGRFALAEQLTLAPHENDDNQRYNGYPGMLGERDGLNLILDLSALSYKKGLYTAVSSNYI